MCHNILIKTSVAKNLVSTSRKLGLVLVRILLFYVFFSVCIKLNQWYV
jgi:hypothetical protein